MSTTIGNKLKKLRKNRNWSQEHVAELLNLSQSSYARIESGESNSWASHLDKICTVFEVSPEDLVKNDNITIGNIGTNNGVGVAKVVNANFPEGILENMQTY